ncbi:CdaR family protein [Pseudozobellia sp. WGM2]|uniref:CdaR family protein n=1 Tax=Pseudozobellia sp. WGM2 TaxID=2787625 RepID=UPI001ADF35A1|nr:YbbR-like domain-containing protein [Pseudozobellia sp. WGM2]
MLLIQKIKNGLKKRKVKIFLIFLLCSALIWFINSLSRSYVNDSVFDLEYVNVPEGFLFESASKSEIDVKLRAGGFQFLRFNFINKKVFIDLTELEKKASTFYASPLVYRKQIEKQLPGNMSLLEIDNDTLFFQMLAVKSKKVPIKPRVELNLVKNYLLDGKMTVSPDSVTITGPAVEIDTIEFINSEKIQLPDMASNFSKDVDLLQSPELENTTYSKYRVTLSGEIARFSEKVFKLPIEKINFPQGAQVKTFPEEVQLLCKAKISRLKELDESDFKIIVDYRSLENSNSNEIELKLTKRPEGVHSANLMEKKVEFLLKRE